MEQVLLDITLILIATRIGSSLSKKLALPGVLGALTAGFLIGPSVSNLVHETESIKLLSELGVIMLMFHAGLETDFSELKKSGKSSFIIAIGGILIPLVLGTATAHFFIRNFWSSVFIGVILTATSVSISAETLTELGKLNTKAGINILGAAVIDDILGLLIISFVLIMAVSSKSASLSEIQMELAVVSIKVVLFIIFAALVIVLLPKVFEWSFKASIEKNIIIVYSIALAFISAYISEFLGIAAITGAYVCGLAISRSSFKEYVSRRINIISSLFLAPIFFASVGIAAKIDGLTVSLIMLTLTMLVVAIIGKLFGCGFAARLSGMSRAESIQVGSGMVSRGEVAIITTNLGLQNGLIDNSMFVPVLIVVVITTLITPILLKQAFSHRLEKHL